MYWNNLHSDNVANQKGGLAIVMEEPNLADPNLHLNFIKINNDQDDLEDIKPQLKDLSNGESKPEVNSTSYDKPDSAEANEDEDTSRALSQVIKQETQEDLFSTCEMKVEMMYCCSCSYCDVDSDRLKIHIFRKHPKEAAIVTNTLNKVDCNIYGIRLFCIRETCTFSSIFCSVYEEHLMTCCSLQYSFPVGEMERLRSTLKFLLDFHSRHRLSAASEFLDYVTCLDTTVMCKDYAKVESQISANLDNYSPSVEQDQGDPKSLFSTPSSLGSSKTLNLYTYSKVDETDMHANTTSSVIQQGVGNEITKQEQYTTLQSCTKTKTCTLPSVGAGEVAFDQTSDNRIVSEAILPGIGKARLPSDSDTSPSKQVMEEDSVKEKINKNINEMQSSLSSSQPGATFQNRVLCETPKVKILDSPASKIESRESMVDRILPASVIEEVLTPLDSKYDDDTTSLFNMKKKSSEKSDFAFSDNRIHSKIPRTESSDQVHSTVVMDSQFINANDNTDINFFPPPPPSSMAHQDHNDDDFDVTLLDLPPSPSPIACKSCLMSDDDKNSRSLLLPPSSSSPSQLTLDLSASPISTTGTYLSSSMDFKTSRLPQTITTAASSKSCGDNSGYSCKKQCPTFFTPHDRDVIKRSFQELTWTERRIYIAKCVRKVPVKRGKGVHSASLKYSLENSDGIQVIVCKTFFLESLGFHPRNDTVVMNTMKTIKIGEQHTAYSFNFKDNRKAKISQRQNKDLIIEKRKSRKKSDFAFSDYRVPSKIPRTESFNQVHSSMVTNGQFINANDNTDINFFPHPPPSSMAHQDHNDDDFDVTLLDLPPPPSPIACKSYLMSYDNKNSRSLSLLPSSPPSSQLRFDLSVSTILTTGFYLPPTTDFKTLPLPQTTTTTAAAAASSKSCGDNSGYSCKKQCPTFFTPHDRELIKRSFQELTWTERRIYIAKCVRKVPVKRGKGVHSASLKYSLENSDGIQVIVCKTFFLKSLGFHPRNDKVVMNTMKTIKIGEQKTVYSFKDKRRKAKNYRRYNKDLIMEKRKLREKSDFALSDKSIPSKMPRTDSFHQVHSTVVTNGQFINANDNTDINFFPPPPPSSMAHQDHNDDDFDVTLLHLPPPPPPIACESCLMSNDDTHSRSLPLPPSSPPPSKLTLDLSVSRILTTGTYLPSSTDFKTLPLPQTTNTTAAAAASSKSCGDNSGYSCKKQCPTFFTPHDRDVIKRSFQELTWTERRIYIANCVRKVPVKRGKGVHSASLKYSLENSDGIQVIVCKTFFLESLGFHPRNDTVVMNTMKKINIGEQPTVHSFMDKSSQGKAKYSQRHNKDLKIVKRKLREKSGFALSDNRIQSKMPQTELFNQAHSSTVMDGRFINANDNTDINFFSHPPPSSMAHQDHNDDDFDVTLLDLPPPPPPIACKSCLMSDDDNHSHSLPLPPSPPPPSQLTLDLSVSRILTTGIYLPPSTDFETLPSPQMTTTAASAAALLKSCGDNSGYSCKKQCPTFFTPRDRDVIKRSFQELTWTERRIYIAKCVRKVPVKRGKGAHSVSLKYSLENSDGIQITVCKTFFLESLGFHPKNDTVVMNTMKAMNIGEQHTVYSFKDNRGKGKNSLRYNKDLIIDHINSYYELEQPHFRREHAPERIFLPSDITVLSMFKDFKAIHKSEMSYATFYRTFKSINITVEHSIKEEA